MTYYPSPRAHRMLVLALWLFLAAFWGYTQSSSPPSAPSKEKDSGASEAYDPPEFDTDPMDQPAVVIPAVLIVAGDNPAPHEWLRVETSLPASYGSGDPIPSSPAPWPRSDIARVTRV